MNVKWSKETPTQPGWYWYRISKGSYPIIERYDMAAHGLALWENGRILPISPGEWAGPIPEPEEGA